MDACTSGQFPYLLSNPDNREWISAKSVQDFLPVVQTSISAQFSSPTFLLRGGLVYHPESYQSDPTTVAYWSQDVTDTGDGYQFTSFFPVYQVCSGGYVEPGANPQNSISEVGVLTIILIVVALFFAGLAGYRAGYSR